MEMYLGRVKRSQTEKVAGVSGKGGGLILISGAS